MVAAVLEGVYDLSFYTDKYIDVNLQTDSSDSRTGTMSFDGTGENNVTPGEWNVDTSGALVFTETDGSEGDFGHGRFLDLSGNDAPRKLVYLRGTGGLELLFIADLIPP